MLMIVVVAALPANDSGLERIPRGPDQQTFPANADQVLETLDHSIPICADESCDTTADLPSEASLRTVNVNLTKPAG
jgi:hypothetical protein